MILSLLPSGLNFVHQSQNFVVNLFAGFYGDREVHVRAIFQDFERQNVRQNVAKVFSVGNDGRSVGVADEDRRLGRDASQVVFWGQKCNLFCRNRWCRNLEQDFDF